MSKKASCCLVQNPRTLMSRRASVDRFADLYLSDSFSKGRRTGSTSTSEKVVPAISAMQSPALQCSLLAEDLQDFCKDVCPLMGCRVMPSRRTGTRCAYIEVDETKVETFRSIIWPENLYARDWSFSERDGQQTKNKNDK